MSKKFRPTHISQTVQLMKSDSKEARMVVEYWQAVLHLNGLESLIKLRTTKPTASKSNLRRLKHKQKVYQDLIASLILSLKDEGIDPTDEKWHKIAFGGTSKERREKRKEKERKDAEKAAKERAKHLEEIGVTEDSVYARLCVGCPDEKKCHEECVHCEAFYDAFVEVEHNNTEKG